MEHTTNVSFIASGRMLLAFAASVLSIRGSISVALVGIGLGLAAGDFFDFHSNGGLASW